MELSETTFTKEIYAMSIIAQNNTNEIALLDCIQRFFQNTILENYWPNAMARKKKASLPFLF